MPAAHGFATHFSKNWLTLVALMLLVFHLHGLWRHSCRRNITFLLVGDEACFTQVFVAKASTLKLPLGVIRFSHLGCCEECTSQQPFFLLKCQLILGIYRIHEVIITQFSSIIPCFSKLLCRISCQLQLRVEQRTIRGGRLTNQMW